MKKEIKKGLENLPKTMPPDMVWENIAQQLGATESKRRAALWLKYTIGIAASLLVLTTAWFLLEKAKDTANQTVVNTTPKPLQQNTTTTLTEKNILPVDTSSNSVIEATEPDTSKVISFTNSSKIASGCVTSNLSGSSTRLWNFGDGNGWTSGVTNNHSYNTSGFYDVTLQSRTYRNANNIGYKDFDTDAIFGFENGLINKPSERYQAQISDTIYFPNNSFFVEDPNSTESYTPLIENEYQSPLKEPLSTFSIDVDNASYSNIRRMLRNGQKPPKDAIRIEEFVNYFDYNYSLPTSNVPFAIHLESASCPWNEETKVISIGIQGKDIPKTQLPASNLVFLIDVSGSMADENKLPLVKQSLKLLVGQLSGKDNIAIVTYAGAAGLVLPSTSANKTHIIKSAIDNLQSGGSTAGGEGLELAYKVAKESFKKEGNNRIILVTDGDFNVGLQTDNEMEKLIEKRRKDGIFLTVCGFGMGNYKDSKMEILADKGNGNYFYIDTYNEGKKVFVTDLRSTLFTIAKDVKIQVEFNPKLVKAYRLIGYENRQMAAQDFTDDTKDAGELGAGHTVTALYEIIPAGSKMQVPGFIELKYQPSTQPVPNTHGNEMLTVKLRYKQPNGNTSKLLTRTLNASSKSYTQASNNFRYACGITVFAMVLRNSKFKGKANYSLAKKLILSTNLNTNNGYRNELLELIALSEKMTY